MSEFMKEWLYKKAKIEMSNPSFFGVTNAKAKEYKAIIAEYEAEGEGLYSETESTEDDIIDVEYSEVNDYNLIVIKN